MMLFVRITLPVDAVDEADARACCIDLLARAVAPGVTQQRCREWIEEYGTVEVVPAAKEGQSP